MSNRDPLDDLRSAWRELEAPDATAEKREAQTEAVLDALRSAWNGLEAPAVRIPAGLGRRSWRRRYAPLLPVAATLLVLCGGTLLARVLHNANAGVGTTTNNDRLAQVDPVIHNNADRTPPTPAEHLRTVEFAAPENGIVMTHGSVRLVLLTPEPNLEPFEETQTPENSR